MTAAPERFAGLDRFEARKQVVAELEKLGLLEKIEPYKAEPRESASAAGPWWSRWFRRSGG